MFAKEKNEENCSLYDFSIQKSKFSLSMLIDKNSLYIHNQLYIIVLPNI